MSTGNPIDNMQQRAEKAEAALDWLIRVTRLSSGDPPPQPPAGLSCRVRRVRSDEDVFHFGHHKDNGWFLAEEIDSRGVVLGGILRGAKKGACIEAAKKNLFDDASIVFEPARKDRRQAVCS